MAKPDEEGGVGVDGGRRRTRARSTNSDEEEISTETTRARRGRGAAKAKKRKLNKKKDDDDDDDEGEEYLELCELCNINENDELSLICDACDKVYHTYCLNPPLKEIPPGEWVCPKCTHGDDATSTQGSKTTSVSPTQVEGAGRSPPNTIEKNPSAALRMPPQLPAIVPPPRPLAPAPHGQTPIQGRQAHPGPPAHHGHQGHVQHNAPHTMNPSAPYHHGYAQDRHPTPEYAELQDQNIYLRRENQKLLDWVDRLTRRIDELQPLEEQLRATQYQCRKMESQLVDLQSQLAMSKNSHYPSNHHGLPPQQQLPKYPPSRPYMPLALPRVDGRQQEIRPMESEYRAQQPYPPRRKEFPMPAVDPDYPRGGPTEDARNMNSNHRYPNAVNTSNDSYYRDPKATNYRQSPMPYPPNSAPQSIPYSQPVYHKPTSSNGYPSYQAPQHYGQARDAQHPQVYHQSMPSQKSAPTDSFLPRPQLPPMNDTYVKQEEPKENAPVYNSEEDENSRKQQENEDDAIHALNSMKRTEANSDRLNMMTPTASNSTPPIGPLSITKPGDIPSTGKRIGLYTPRSRRLMLDRYLLKRTKRLSRHKWFKYPVRKTLADTRPRVKGRFVKHDSVDEDEASYSPGKPQSPHEANMEEIHNMADFDYISAFAECVKDSKEDVDKVLVDILKNKQRQGELISWDTWTMELEQSLNGLLPRVYMNSPFPAIFGELVYILGDAEEDCNQENYCKALQAGAIYVAICLSLYIAVHNPDTYDGGVSPILSHYMNAIKDLWQREPNVQKKHTFAMMKSIVDGIAGVICIGYDDGKQYLKSIPDVLEEESKAQ